MDYKVVEVKENLLIENSEKANQLRDKLTKKGVFFINVMASPGSGKTTLLVNLINRLKNEYSIGVMEADIDGDVDADRIHRLTGVPSIQVHTSGACHLTAQMVEDAISSFDIKDINLLILENVGNLVCPAEFDTGAHLNLVLLSIPEGDDKPLKYPLMFEVANIVAITKMDTLPAFNFDIDKCRNNIHLRNKDIEVYPISALKDQGVDELYNALLKFIKK
ncbi:MAG: hydrogenase nickel incorporation protein HypB [Bacilli bacterium]|nr:hydrogenase nickel incorporation protein HypB [Bacilli bacterium]